LKYAFDENWLGEHVLELLILTEDASQNLSLGFFVYLSQQGNLDRTKIIEAMEALPPAAKKKVITFFDSLREEVLNEKNRKAAVNMIRKGYSDAEICDVLEVTPEYVAGIRVGLGATE
jgi:SOS response regulatory protein OraA/RecX